MSVIVGELRRGAARPVLGVARGITASRATKGAAVVAAVAWSVVAAVRESRFLDGRYDTGNFVQSIWTTAHGHFLQVTEVGGGQVSRLGIHVDPIIALFAPLWWVWPSPLLLLTVQAFAVAAGALPLFWLGRKYLPRERDAALLAGAYLLSPTVSWNAIVDFHTVLLAVPLLLFAIWYLDEGRFVPFGLAAGAAVLCQEQIGLIIGCLGLWYAWRRRRFHAGFAIAVLGFGASAVDFLVIIRHYSGGSPYAARFGGSPTAIVGDLLTHPLRILEQINTHDLLGLLLAWPVLGLCFGSAILLVAAPQIALLLLSRRAGDWNWLGINVVLLVPFIRTATTLTLARLAGWRRSGDGTSWINAGHVFTAAIAVAIITGPFSIYGVDSMLFPPHSPVAAQRHAVSLVPANAAVSATNHLALPLAGRARIFVFPVIRRADWVVVDATDTRLPDMSYLRRRHGIGVGVSDLYKQPKLMRRELAGLSRSKDWRLVYRGGTIYVFRRAPHQHP